MTHENTKMKTTDDESCDYTDYETDGFWSSEKTLLESVQGTTTTTTRRRKKKRKAKDREDNKKDPAVATASPGLRQQWRSFLQDHDEEWHDFWKVGRHCFIDTVRNAIIRGFFFIIILFLILCVFGLIKRFSRRL